MSNCEAGKRYPLSLSHNFLSYLTLPPGLDDMVGFSTFSAAATALVAATFVVAQDPNYKVPFADGSGDWAAAFKKAKAVV